MSAVVRPTLHLDVIEADPTDNKFLECALEGRANYIVSGDHHLLDLGNYQGIKIVRVAEFLPKVAES